MAAAPAEAVKMLRLPASTHDDAVAVAPGRIAMTGIQLGFSLQDADVRLAFDRLDKALESVRASRAGALMVNSYSLSRATTAKLRAQREHYFDKTRPILYNVFLSEGLASLDATFGVEVTAVTQ